MKGWQKVFGSDQSYHAEIVRSVLEDHDINAVIVNKKDSSYNSFGQCEVYTAPDDVVAALQIINNDITFK